MRVDLRRGNILVAEQLLHGADDGAWVLQVSKTEVLAADKLHRRNLAFNDLAAHCGVDSYDGWDVGKPEP